MAQSICGLHTGEGAAAGEGRNIKRGITIDGRNCVRLWNRLGRGMELAQHFERFLRNISLDEPKRDRIRSKHRYLRRALEADQYLGPALYETFLQGSYVHGTAIRPLGNQADFDVDVCCSLNLDAVPHGTEEPRRLVRWLARRLKKVESYEDKVSTRPRCVRIDFPGDFHMDVVPLAGDSRQAGNILHIPNRTVNGWEATNPKGLDAWYHQQNARTNGRFVRVAKMLKHWRNQALPKNARLPSIALEVMIAQAWPFLANSDADAISRVLRNLANNLRFSFSVPRVMNPSLQNENLLRDLEPDQLETLKAGLSEAADIAEGGRRELDQARSISLWQRLFRTRFPQRAT